MIHFRNFFFARESMEENKVQKIMVCNLFSSRRHVIFPESVLYFKKKKCVERLPSINQTLQLIHLYSKTKVLRDLQISFEKFCYIPESIFSHKIQGKNYYCYSKCRYSSLFSYRIVSAQFSSATLNQTTVQNFFRTLTNA